MTLQQVIELENDYINNKLNDTIDKELQHKLGLNLTKEMRAKISWCALLVSWILLFQKAEFTFYY